MDNDLKDLFEKMDKRLASMEKLAKVQAAISIVTPESGLHLLKDAWKATAYLKEYCEILTPKLQTACDRTRIVVERYLRSARGLHYLSECEQNAGTHREAVLEKGLYEKSRSKPLPGPNSLWHTIIRNQVPVKARKRSETGLKCIDLLATTEDGHPVIIELKVAHKHCETPFRAILEAASYACVLQADWQAFSREWQESLKSIGIDVDMPQDLSSCKLVLAATPAYWTFWENEQRKSIKRAHSAFTMLLHEFAAIGFPVYFTSIDENTLEIVKHSFPPE